MQSTALDAAASAVQTSPVECFGTAGWNCPGTEKEIVRTTLAVAVVQFLFSFFVL